MNKRKLLENLKAISHCCGNEVKDIDRAGRRAYLIAAFARKDELLREAMVCLDDHAMLTHQELDLIERIRKEINND